MSYCRWSTDDHLCDLYCYEHCDGGYQTHVANNRPVYRESLPPPLNYGEATTEQFMERYHKIGAMLEAAERVKIGLPHDGASFNDETLEEFLSRLLMLRECGYRFPDSVLDEVRAEIAEQTPR